MNKQKNKRRRTGWGEKKNINKRTETPALKSKLAQNTIGICPTCNLVTFQFSRKTEDTNQYDNNENYFANLLRWGRQNVLQ
jgi:hypothetical protein